MTSRAVVLLLLVAALGACSGSEPEPQPVAETPSASASPTDPDPTAYLPAPDGVVLTEAGAELALREPAVAAWTPRQDVVGVVDVTVTRIRETTVEASLAGYEFRGADATATPYFVTARVTNVGETDLGGRQLPLYVADSTERLVPPTGIAPGYRPCAVANLPATFAPGATASTCQIFLVPRGADLDVVTFRPGEGVVPITWSGTVEPLREPRKSSGDRRRP